MPPGTPLHLDFVSSICLHLCGHQEHTQPLAACLNAKNVHFLGTLVVLHTKMLRRAHKGHHPAQDAFLVTRAPIKLFTQQHRVLKARWMRRKCREQACEAQEISTRVSQYRQHFAAYKECQLRARKLEPHTQSVKSVSTCFHQALPHELHAWASFLQPKITWPVWPHVENLDFLGQDARHGHDHPKAVHPARAQIRDM